MHIVGQRAKPTGEPSGVHVLIVAAIVVPVRVGSVRAEPAFVEGTELEAKLSSRVDVGAKYLFVDMPIFVAPPMVPFDRQLISQRRARIPVLPSDLGVLP